MLCAVFACTEEKLQEDQNNLESVETLASANAEGPCVVTNLVAGQHYVAGSVTVDIEGDNLIITYTSNSDWIIGTTHLSVGNCDEDWAPLTGSGNPKIGQFEYTVPFSVEPHEVVYVISLDGLDDHYCFAAHAEVEGPDGGETAWAEGSQFEGSGWAMYNESFLSECEEGDGGNNPPY